MSSAGAALNTLSRGLTRGNSASGVGTESESVAPAIDSNFTCRSANLQSA
jgi:hypothetical protein